MAEELSILNDPPEVLEGPQLLHQLIRWEDHKDSCAVDFTSKGRRQQYSYAEIQSCVASLVTRIQEKLDSTSTGQTRQSTPQHIVPVLVPQSPGLYISQLAVLNSGGGFCPINLDAPTERIKFVVGDVAADLIITTAEFQDAVTWENGPKVILVDEFPVPPKAGTPRGESREASPRDLAYVMYTSGSSGKPKGVAVSHLAVSQSLLAHQRHIPSFRRFLQFAAPSFDVSVFEIYFPLIRGCTLVGCDRSQLLNDLPGMINELEVDACELTPTVVGSLLQKRANAPGLKLLLTIGEMLTRPIVEEFGGSDSKSAMLYGMYGPTEAAIHCTIFPSMSADTKPGNIGIPFDTVSTFIAAAITPQEKEGTISFLPVGELGELVLGGPQLANGYLNREEQNKLAFVSADGKSYYRTGDKARQLEDGTIEILGRISAGQVKLRGQRVELGEIEEAVYKHPGIKTVTAVVLNGALVVFALVGDDDVDSEAVLKTCAKWLPKFMIPSEVVLLQTFSYLPSGKVDKRKLEADYQKRREAEEDENSDSMTPTQRTVKNVLHELLGPLSSSTRLTAAGLDSLMAIRVASKLRAAGFNLTTVAVLQAETLTALAQLCDTSGLTPSPKTATEIGNAQDSVKAVLNGHADDLESTMPCTPLQSAMLSETAVDEKAYHNWVELELTGVTDLDQVISAFLALAEQNPILRTGFTESPDTHGFVQVIWQSFPESQIELVEDFRYSLAKSHYSSLHHPLSVQIMQSNSNIKLLMHLHHALYDAWSLELLLDDFNVLLMKNSVVSRPPFANLVQGYLDGTLAIDDWSSKEYWKDHLADVELRQMPNFHTKSSASGLAIARLATSISTADAEFSARRLNSSPQSLFQAAYATLLSSYLGSSDICFGTVFSGRTLPVAGIEDIAGPCFATLPIRVDVSASVSLKDLVQELNSSNRKHLEHSTIPLRDIKAACGLNPRQPFFDTLLIWQQTLHSYDHSRKHVALVDTVDNLEFNITLEVIPGTGNIELKANYQQSLFPESQIDILLRQIQQIVLLLMKDESASLADISEKLSDGVLSIENANPETALGPETLSSPVERMAAEDPHRPAINFARSINSKKSDIQIVTYMELNTHANQMGHQLLQQNVLPGELVCICLEKSADLYASILATAKVGAGYLPLTPDVPQERLEHILREANVKVLMAHFSSRSLLKALQNVKVIYVDKIDFSIFPSKNIPGRSNPENLSYCVFTSGSTGTPKGVLVTQGNLLGNLDVLEEIYPATKDSRLLQSCSQAFDVSVFEIFFTWRIGGCICSATKDVIFRDIENAIRVLQVTHLSLTPTVAALVDPKNVPNVKFLVTAGETLSQKVFNAWADRGLYNAYGPSETTNVCTVNPKVTSKDFLNNLGPPFRNMAAFILSPGAGFSLALRGGEGEICFSGAQVFRGYVDKALESGRIIDHPTYGRVYRTGDFGRLMHDGSIAFTGRKDDQVKIRGQRVELGEINNVMLRSKDVRDCVTMVINEGDNNSARLVCFWTSDSNGDKVFECLQPDSTVISSLFKSLEAALPAYMIPSALIPVSYLPSTSQGKIDKRLLNKKFHILDVNYLDLASQASRSALDHTWTDLEKQIAKSLAQITDLPLEQITPVTSFFSLGIDSISAISFSTLLRQNTKRQVEISDVLKYSSVVRLAEKISVAVESNAAGPTLVEGTGFGFDEPFVDATTKNFEQAGRRVQSILPCTPLQEAMLSAADSSSESLYSNQVLIAVNGDLKKLQECWSGMVRRHEILRTCFVSTDMPRYAYAQVVLEEYDLKFGSIRNGDSPTETSEFQPPYSLDLVSSSGSTKLLISMHHALYDGAALSVLYEEVEKLYHRHKLPTPISFAPFLQSMTSMDTEKADNFWGMVLKGCSPTRLKSKIDSNGQAAARIQRISAKPSLNWIEDGIKKYSTSLLAVCQAAWSTILSERVQETDICFGNVVSGRTLPVEGIERLVAPCFNTIPTRLQDLHKNSHLEAFRKLQALNVDSLPFQLTPLRRLQSKYSPDGSRLFDTLFILQQPSRDLDSSIWTIEEDNGAMDFPLVCEVVPRHSDDTLEIILHSYNSVISSEDAMALLHSFEDKIQESLRNPRRQLLSTDIKDEIIAKSINRTEAKSEKTDATSSKAMTPEEKAIRDVISNFTDVPPEKIGRDVSIFRLGLDSISTVQVATRLRKEGHSVVASDILEHPTIAQLSAYLSQQSGNAFETSSFDFHAFDRKYREGICVRHEIPSDQIEAVRPCTAVQKGMIAQSLHSDGQEYVNSMWMELLPSISLPKLKAAWAEVCEEHEMLRTGFVQSEDPDHLFLMITSPKDQLSLPWYEDQSPQHSLRQPWSLSLLKKEDKKVIRFQAHHALYDAQSIQMILSDVTKVYNSGSIIAHPPITSLLGAIIRDSETDEEAKKSFWQKDENKIAVNHFPDLTPLRVSTATSGVREIMSKISIAELEESCRQNGVTVQAAAQAAWARLLAAYIGETSTTFGMTLSGRSIHEDAENISFPSIVTLPVRCDVSGTNAELLTRTMDSNAQLHKHQFTPLTSIQKWAGFPEGKIFDTLFAYQKLPGSEDNVEPLWRIVREEASVDYAVSMEIRPTAAGEVALRLTFREDIIPAEQSIIILKQYDAILLDTLRNPHNTCDIAPKLGNDLLAITPAKENVLSDDVQLLHEYVERGAKQWPNKKALEFATSLEPGNVKSRSWTYDELNKEANKIANLLIQLQVQPGQIIAICFDKCAEASFAITGILKAGCAYVALDSNAPADRLKFIIEDSGAKMVLTAGKPGKTLQENLDKEIITLDSRESYEKYSSDAPKLSRKINPQDISYCLYTSGTTGTPKGCLLTHENAVQAMLSFQRLFADHWTADSKWLQFASFHFDVSVLEQFWSWSVGICVASAPRDLIFGDIPSAIQQLGITHIDLTPSLARLLHPDDVPSLCKGVFITGGEQLREEIIDVWGEHACIYNGYGPTEATIGVTMYPRVPKNGKPSNIGPQFDNVGSFVLKPGTAFPVLRGGIGELCVSGKLVGKGYLNRADLTTERFPTLESFNERVYRTGDLVRILHDGTFIFLGRADDQVKLRGQRLELSEINEVIKKSVKELKDVVTLVLKHSTQQKEQLVTFFVAGAESEGMIPTMRDACKGRLPGYMVPTHFIPIKSLPLNANNKADSKQLAAMHNELSVDDLQKLSNSNQQDTKWNEQEKKVVEILANALQVEVSALTRGTNIFELGLDSISIIGFPRALQDGGLENAKLSVVKSNPSIGSLVAALINGKEVDQGRENAYVDAAQQIAAFSQKHMVGVCQELGVESKDVECIAPCTPVQEGMIYRFLESDDALYFNKFRFRLDKEVDTEKLVGAWKRVVAQLQVLRTKFVATDDGYAQVVLKTAGIAWQQRMVDYDDLEKSEALKQPYALGLNSTSSGNTMAVRMFHGIYDGNSLAMLLQRLVEEYRGQEQLEYGPAFQPSLPYGPLARISGAQQFWEEHLKEWSYEPMHTISDSSKDVVATSTLSDLGGFEDLRKGLGVTPQAVVQAAWLSVLHTLTSPNLTIGIVTSGRAIDFEGADKVIGPLFNTVPFHSNIQQGMTFAALISECHNFNMKMQDFQHTPLKEIQKWSPAKPGQALFETLFVFQRSEADEEKFAEGLWTQINDDEHIADYLLAFEATLDSESKKLELTLVAQGSVITQSGASALLELLEKILNDILKNGGQSTVFQNSGTRMTNGTSHLTNGSSSSNLSSGWESPHLESFKWTEQTEKMRLEIASLAKVPESSVQETSSIFELGLDSIDVIRLSSRLKKQGIEIPVSAIIKGQTIAKMAVNISAKSSSGSQDSAGELLENMSRSLTKYLKANGKLPEDAEAVLPATPLQQSMVNEMIKSDYERYFNIEASKLHKNVDPRRLAAAVKKALGQSPIFRTSFVEIEDPHSPVSFAQVVHRQRDAAEIPMTTLAKGQSIEAFMDVFKTQSVKLAKTQQALCQIHLVSAGSSTYLFVAISHALYDGTSIRTLHEDISKAYRGDLAPRPDFTPFLEEVVQSTTNDAKRFWRNTLSNLPPATFPRKELAEYAEPTVYLLEKQSRVPLKDVEALCKSSRITLQTLGQTCWALVLAHLMGQLDVVFGSVLSCRNSEEANEVMFPLMNTVAVRSVLHGSLEDMLKYMQDLSDTTRQYQHFPLGTAQAYALASRQDNSLRNDTTLFDTLFIYQGRRQTGAGQQLYESVYGASDVEFPVCVEMEIVNDEYLSWTTACKSIARTQGETDEIIKALDAVLQRMISGPQAPTIVSDAEGVSVCGLPKFRKSNSQPKQTTTSVANRVSNKWSDTEVAIRKSLHEISDVPEDDIRKDSTIFHLGLDSILVLKLPALLRGYGIKISVSDILREQTVHAMAQFVLRSKPENQQSLDADAVLSKALSHLTSDSEVKALEKEVGEIESVMPVTAGQLYMIRQWQTSRGALFYPTFTYSIEGKFCRARLDSAWKGLLQRHPILRTGFVEVDSDLIQVTFKDPKNKVIYNSTKRPAASDLRSPPISLVVEEANGPSATLKLTIHHALYDGISLPILFEELQSLYRGAELEPSSANFKTFVAQSISSSSSAAKNKWTSYLKEAAGLASKAVNGTSTASTGRRTEVFHPSLRIGPLKNLAQESGVSIDALFLAGISKQYAQHLDSSTDTVIFGIYLANRAPFGDDLSNVAAPTLNLLPLCVKKPLEREIPELAKDIQKDLSEISNKDMVSASLEHIYEWTGVRVDFFVNILKSSPSTGKETVFQELEDLPKKAEIVNEVPNKDISGGGEAYLPTIDVEIRYDGEMIDMGVFAPSYILDLEKAKEMVRAFREFWV